MFSQGIQIEVPLLKGVASKLALNQATYSIFKGKLQKIQKKKGKKIVHKTHPNKQNK